jgi:hypothetical protein
MVLQKAACPPKLLVTTPSSSATDQFPFPSVHSIHLLTALPVQFIQLLNPQPNEFVPDFFKQFNA